MCLVKDKQSGEWHAFKFILYIGFKIRPFSGSGLPLSALINTSVYICRMTSSATAFLSLGSNLGDRLKNLQQAVAVINLLAAVPFTIKTSKVYETAAWGKTDQPAFLNAVMSLQTSLSPHQLLNKILEAEQLMGRVRDEKWGPRTIDIDILYYNNDIMQHDALVVPHPEIAQRRFVLQPLCDLAPDFMHPVLHQTSRQLLDNCADVLPVHIFTEKLF